MENNNSHGEGDYKVDPELIDEIESAFDPNERLYEGLIDREVAAQRLLFHQSEEFKRHLQENYDSLTSTVAKRMLLDYIKNDLEMADEEYKKLGFRKFLDGLKKGETDT